ncbi:MAG: hypothetical protein FWH03_06365 [Firmicutes bacterium]|nr:hypothetical protein [Bacillota bacterium]
MADYKNKPIEQWTSEDRAAYAFDLRVKTGKRYSGLTEKQFIEQYNKDEEEMKKFFEEAEKEFIKEKAEGAKATAKAQAQGFDCSWTKREEDK